MYKSTTKIQNDKFFMNNQLVLYIYSLYALRDRCEDFVWDGAECFGYAFDGHCFAEDFDGVTYFDAGHDADVDHAQIHADIADCRAFNASDNEFGMAVAEAA